jgi:hypothetical protein
MWVMSYLNLEMKSCSLLTLWNQSLFKYLIIQLIPQETTTLHHYKDKLINAV